MLDDRERYIELCATHKVPPDDNILKRLTASSATSELVLSGSSLTKETCDMVAQLLLMSSSIQRLNLSDCLLPARGLASITRSLIQGHLSTLNLKGNNIAGTSISKLGLLLRSNTSLKQLCLEWNSLGLFPDHFKDFCTGLAKNSFLEELNLQNNQLSPECGGILSDAISHHCALQSLDLRWNNLGWQGGQHLLHGLQNNRIISTICLQGNCIPGDLALTIEQCASHNQSHRQVVQECAARSHLLEKHVRHLEAKRTFELHGLAKQNEDIIKETELRLSSVQELLSEKSSLLARTQVQLKGLEAELRQTELRCQDLQKQLEEMVDEQKQEKERGQFELERLNKKLQQQEKNMREHLAATEKQVHVEQKKVSELEIKLALAHEEINKLLSDQTERTEVERRRHIEELACVTRTFEDRLDQMQQGHEEHMREGKSEAFSTHQRLTNRLHVLEASNSELERKVLEQSLQVAVMSQKLACSAELSASAVHDAREKELARLKTVEERLASARDDKAHLEKQLEVAQHNNSQLQEQNSALISELAEPQRKLTHLLEELSSEKQLSARLRGEKREETARADARKAEADRLQAEVEHLTRQVADIKNINNTRDHEVQRERSHLLTQLQKKDDEIGALKSEQVERAAALYTAFTKYLGTLNPGNKPGVFL